MIENTKLFDISSQFPAAKGAYHLAYYQPPAVGDQDQISKYLIDFKAGREPQTTQWIRLAAMLVSQTFSYDVVIRALGGKETTATGITSLDKLCYAVARKNGARYCPERLQRLVVAQNTFWDNDPGQVELTDTYRFNAAGLSETTRVLIVGDFETSAETLQSIATAVRQALPAAEVHLFALAWTDPKSTNAHLDQKYFVTHVAPSHLKGEETMRTPTPAKEPTTKPAGKANGKNAHPAGKTEESKAASKQAPLTSQKKNELKPPVPNLVPPRRGVGTMAVTSAVAVVLLFSAFVLFAKRPSTPKPTIAVGAPPPIETIVHQSAPKVAKPPPRPVDQMIGLPTGIVTVPSAGLRGGHSLNAKPVRASVKSGERVSILKRYSSSTGPSWMQIQTKSGKVGWVWASVVKEQRPRKGSR